MRIRSALVLAALLALGPVTGADDLPALEATLDLETSRFGPYTPMFLPLRPSVPKDAEVPDGLQRGLYARIRWGEGRGLLFALEAAPGREQLWIDRDLDGDTRIESPVPWAGSGRSMLQDVRVHVAYEGEDLPVSIRLQRGTAFPIDKVQIVPWAHRRGFVELEGRLRCVALVDGNADLRFDDPKRDAAYLDLDGDGTLEGRSGSPERLALDTPFRLGDAGYVIRVPRPSGRLVRLERTKDVPPPTPPTWLGSAMPAAGRRQAKPTESLKEILGRIEKEQDLPYAQRYQTVMLLGRVGTGASFRELLRLAEKDKDRSIRAAAVRAMGNPAYLDVAHQKVVALTSHPEVSIANGAVQALHDMGHPDRESVYVRLLKEAPSSVAGQAGRYLAYIGTPKAVQAVIRAYDGANDGPTRSSIYQGLRSLPDGPPKALVDRAARDDYAHLRGTALRDQRVLAPDRARESALLAAQVRPVVNSLAQAVIDVLSAEGDGKSVKAMLPMVAEGPPALETYVARKLAPLRGKDAIRVLIKALSSRDEAHAPLRRIVAHALAGIDRPEVTAALVKRVRKEKDESVLLALLDALGDHSDPSAVPTLLKYAKKRDRAVRQAANRALGRIGFQDEKARRHLLSLLTAKSWEDHILALDAAAASGDARLCSKVIPSLDHEKWQVRLAAAEAVGKLRCPTSILPLIARLEEEEEARVKDQVAESLYRITGINLYDEPAIWRKWWKDHGNTFQLPERVDELPPPDQGGTEAGFYGIPVRSNRVIFVIDQSGSMSAQDMTGKNATGNRLDTAIREALAATRMMSDRDRVNVILFHTTVHPWQDKLQRLTKGRRKALESHLDGKTPTGGTNLYDALEMALLDKEVDTIFLLSDGVPGAGKFVQKDDILREVRRINQTRRIRIHTISIGMHSDLMEQLAKQHGGQYIKR